MSRLDGRGWTALGLFLTFWVMIAMLASIPAIRGDETFKSLLVMLATGGPLLVGKFYFGNSKQDKPPE